MFHTVLHVIAVVTSVLTLLFVISIASSLNRLADHSELFPAPEQDPLKEAIAAVKPRRKKKNNQEQHVAERG